VLTRLARTPNGGEYSFRLFQLPFRTYLGRDRGDKRALLERIMNGTCKLRASHLQLVGSKLFLLASIAVEQEQHALSPAVIAEASLSMLHPITLRVGKREHAIGNREEFMHRRLAIQAAISRLRRAAAFNRGGHGRKRKMKGLDSYLHLEKRYVEQRLHVYSRMLIDLCVKYGAATLLLVNQQAREEMAGEDPFLLRNWSYYSLKEKIAYKAARAGIQLIVE